MKLGIFEKTYIKLSLYYIAIIMFFSVTFSISNYRIATIENQANFRRQIGILRDIPYPRLQPNYNIDNIIKEQNLELHKSNQKILIRLILLNVWVLILGYICSYYLARQSLKPIKESNERLATFAADASHELRTPLTSLKASTELNLMEKNMSKIKSSLHDNLEEINNFEYLINRILLSTTLDGSANIEIKDVDIKQVVDAVSSNLEHKLKTKNITINSDVKKDKIKTDKTILTQILNEIIDNAIKYSPEGSEIDIKSYKKGSHHIISIQDHGVGISADEINKVFNKFYRVEKSRNSSGYGIGLSLVNDYVKILGGKIRISSKVKEGSTFSIIL